MTDSTPPWQWDEPTWRGHVDQVRAGRSLAPESWPDGRRVAIIRDTGRSPKVRTSANAVFALGAAASLAQPTIRRIARYSSVEAQK